MVAMAGLHMIQCLDVTRRTHRKLWNFIDSSLHIAYRVGQDSPPTPPCQYCLEADHASQICALAPHALHTKGSSQGPPLQQGKGPGTERQIFNSLHCILSSRNLTESFSLMEQREMCISRSVCLLQHQCSLRGWSSSQGLLSTTSRFPI